MKIAKAGAGVASSPTPRRSRWRSLRLDRRPERPRRRLLDAEFTPRRARSIWSQINRDKVEALVAAGKMRPPASPRWSAPRPTAAGTRRTTAEDVHRARRPAGAPRRPAGGRAFFDTLTPEPLRDPVARATPRRRRRAPAASRNSWRCCARRNAAPAVSGLGLVLSLPNVGETVEAARMAEQAGFESVWTTDFTDRSATVAMGAIAAATERITIGSAIAYAFGHTPLVLAAEARDLDALSGGRIILGLGTGTRRATGGCHDRRGLGPHARHGRARRHAARAVPRALRGGVRAHAAVAAGQRRVGRRRGREPIEAFRT